MYIAELLIAHDSASVGKEAFKALLIWLLKRTDRRKNWETMFQNTRLRMKSKYSQHFSGIDLSTHFWNATQVDES